MSFLDIQGLSLKAGATEILRDVSLQLERGQVLGLIGESGAGKSTLALAAIGFLKPGLTIAGGKVSLDGIDLVAASPDELSKLRQSKVAYVAQSAAAAFNPFYRLGHQVTELRALRDGIGGSERRQLAAELFARLQLPEPDRFGLKYPHQVSGGQLQRAMIAMALLNNPELIVFDEPTTALDVTTQVEVLKVIRQVIAAEGCSAIYVSHDIAVVSQVCDRIVVVRNGVMVEANETRRIIDSPQTDYARALVASRSTSDFNRETSDTQILIEGRGLDLGYGSVRIVENVDITVGRSEIVALVGESGSGKTTVARAIAGLLVPRRGSVTLSGIRLAASVDDRNDDQRRRIQFIHQLPDVALNPRQTVRAVLARPLVKFMGLSGADLEERLRGLMAEVELPAALLDRYPGALSGGQKQRVYIARCLAAEPDILICDEVTSALDPLVEESILSLLWHLNQDKGLGMLFITHNLGVTRRFTDRVVIMERGRIVESGTTKAIFAAPGEEYTKRLMLAEPSTRAGWLDERIASGD
ncbi:MAG: ABC transporter [Rhodobacterales bacterium 32-67-9]|nr:MAG: ABC transporter [Rhodobacterales bacterium 32-67-9]